MNENQPSPMFSASCVQVTEEGLIFVCSDELEAQRAFLEGQARGRRVKIDGKNLIMLNSEKKPPCSEA
jgi:hypothetical protein